MTAVVPATNIFTKMLFIPEVTFNTLPATPTMVDIPFVDSSLSPDIMKVTDNTIQGDTMHRWVVPTSVKTAGTISGELSHGNADWLFQAITYGAWASNSIAVGSTPVSYSIEVGHPDIGQYFLFTGSVVDKLSFTFAPAGIITYKADFIGAAFSMGTTTSATTVTAASQTAPLTTVTGTIKLAGAAVGYISGGTFNFDRKLTPVYVLGSSEPNAIVTSFFGATGSLDLLVVDEVAYGYFDANTSVSIDWTFTDGTNTYEMKMPNVYLETFTMNNTSTGPVTAKANFTAVYDTATSTVLKVTRSS